MVLRARERIRDACRTAVDRSVRGGTDVEFGKLVELDVHLVMRVALALGLDFPGLFYLVSIYLRMNEYTYGQGISTCSKSFAEPPLASIRLAKLRADE